MVTRVKVFDFSKNIEGLGHGIRKIIIIMKRYPKYTNIINPYNQKEVRFTDKMNKLFEKRI